jgi:hypothetical protein
MATTTPNYGWDVPTSTDYVKDGATAIETLGDDIDSSLFSITGGKNVGYQYISSASFSAASTVNVNSVFTSTYKSYVIYVYATGTAPAGIRIQYLKATVPQASGYYGGILYSNFTGGQGQVPMNNVAQGTIGTIGTTGSFTRVEIGDPNQASGASNFTYGLFQSMYAQGGEQAVGGVLVASDTYDGFRLTTSTGTMTGSVRIYGIRD